MDTNPATAHAAGFAFKPVLRDLHLALFHHGLAAGGEELVRKTVALLAKHPMPGVIPPVGMRVCTIHFRENGPQYPVLERSEFLFDVGGELVGLDFVTTTEKDKEKAISDSTRRDGKGWYVIEGFVWTEAAASQTTIPAPDEAVMEAALAPHLAACAALALERATALQPGRTGKQRL